MVGRVIIVDDQEYKRADLKSFAKELACNVDVTLVSDYRPAMTHLTHFNFDLLVLDMSFETSKGVGDETVFQGLAGLQILQHMRRLELEVPTILVTSHTDFNDQSGLEINGLDNLNHYLKKSFGDVFLGAVLYDSSGKWKKVAKELLVDVIK